MSEQRETRWGGLPWLIVGVAVIVLFLIAIAWALGGDGDVSAPDVSSSDIESADPVLPAEAGSGSGSEGDVGGTSAGEVIASATRLGRSARERRVPRYRIGETQYVYPSNNVARAAYGTEGAHCFVGETCQAIPPPSDFVDSLLGGGGGASGPLGSGVGGGLRDAVSGLGSGGTAAGGGFGASGSGVSATGRAGRAIGESISSAGASARAARARARAGFARQRAIRRARNDALRVPAGQPGAHCFTGEDCPPLPVGSQAPPPRALAPGLAPATAGPAVVATAPGAGEIAAAARTPACAECLARLPAGTHVIVGPTCPLPATAS